MSGHRRVAAFTVPGQGHLNRMLPLVAGLCERGVQVDFFAHAWARRQIEQTGARFVHLYENRDMLVPDNSSVPFPIRSVSFSGYWGEDVAREVAALAPDLILHDTFAVIGRVVAYHLGLPRVNMRSGHNLQPERQLAMLQASGAVVVSDQCLTSVHMLRERHGIPDASPFTFFIDDQADLNIYSEPPEFLPPEQRGPFEPLEFFGSYWPAGSSPALTDSQPFGPDAESCLRVFAGFGTAVWMECPGPAMAALAVTADALASYPNARGLISIGGDLLPPEALDRLRRPNVQVVPFVDQIDVLRHASAFLTHNGLNSTHEAIFHQVPMISHPFFGDQPALAAQCQAMGLAVPLGRGPVTVADVQQALDRIQAEAPAFRARLAQARQWELAVMAQRPAVLDRILGMMG